MAEIKTLRYADFLSEPADVVHMQFKCDNPVKLLDKMPMIIQVVLEVNGTKLAEKIFRWDSTDGSFHGVYAGFRKYDAWTKMWVDIMIWGKQDLQTKFGACRIKVKGYLITDFDYYTSLQQGFWWTYTYLYYNRVRKKHFEKSKECFYAIVDEIKGTLGVLKKDMTAHEEGR